MPSIPCPFPTPHKQQSTCLDLLWMWHSLSSQIFSTSLAQAHVIAFPKQNSWDLAPTSEVYVFTMLLLMITQNSNTQGWQGLRWRNVHSFVKTGQLYQKFGIWVYIWMHIRTHMHKSTHAHTYWVRQRAWWLHNLISFLSRKGIHLKRHSWTYILPHKRKN